jgi:hypothetical protein
VGPRTGQDAVERSLEMIIIVLMAERVNVAVKLLTPIREVLGSNLGQDTSYPD